jgi:hypothetical protein
MAGVDRTSELGSRWWMPLWEFAVHVFVGTFIFVLIGAVAIFIHWLNRLVAAEGWIAIGLSTAEYMIFAVDLLLFLIFTIRVALKLGKSLWTNESWRSSR